MCILIYAAVPIEMIRPWQLSTILGKRYLYMYSVCIYVVGV